MDSFNVLNKEKIEVNKMKSKDIFENLKSDYFLQKLFNILLKKKSLDIIKYNKNIKNRIKINIQDYKEYSELYSSIEIEIKPVEDEWEEYDKFIHINEENKIYYHIYFNDNKKEIKRNYFKENDKIKTIKIIIDYQIKTFAYLFYCCDIIESIKFKKFYRNNVTNMRRMFSKCSSLKELNLSNFNTNNVTDMSQMFYMCSSLKELNLSNFNTNNVTDMCAMFSECSSLKEIHFSNFNTNNVTNMYSMFYKCSSLKELDLSNFNTKNVTNMGKMFNRCSSLIELNLSNFNFNNETDIDEMFSKCSKEFIMKIKSQYKFIKEEAFN